MLTIELNSGISLTLHEEALKEALGQYLAANTTFLRAEGADFNIRLSDTLNDQVEKEEDSETEKDSDNSSAKQRRQRRTKKQIEEDEAKAALEAKQESETVTEQVEEKPVRDLMQEAIDETPEEEEIQLNLPIEPQPEPEEVQTSEPEVLDLTSSIFG